MASGTHIIAVPFKPNASMSPSGLEAGADLEPDLGERVQVLAAARGPLAAADQARGSDQAGNSPASSAIVAATMS